MLTYILNKKKALIYDVYDVKVSFGQRKVRWSFENYVKLFITAGTWYNVLPAGSWYHISALCCDFYPSFKVCIR